MWWRGTRDAAAPVPWHWPGVTGSHQTVETICLGTEQGKAAAQRRDRCRVAEDEAVTHHRGAGALPGRRGYGDKRGPGIAGTATRLNDRRSLAFSFLTRPWVPGFYVKVAAWRVRQRNWSSRRALQGKMSSIVIADAPQGRLRDAEERFSQRFPSSRRGLRSFTPFLSHTNRRWGSIGSRGTAADHGRQGGLPHGFLRGQPRGYKYGYGLPCAWASLG